MSVEKLTSSGRAWALFPGVRIAIRFSVDDPLDDRAEGCLAVYLWSLKIKI
jgi:hypothetical protein